jgi:PadR family transcriptional regulator AphA
MSLRHVLLVYLGTGAATGYDIVKGFQHTYGYLWNASFQQVYRDLAKLHSDGLIDCEVVDNAPRPPRKIYTLNDSGRATMQAWLATPVKPPHVNSALLVKLASIHLIDAAAFRKEFADYRDSHVQALRELKQVQAVFQSLPPGVLEKFGGVYLTLLCGIRQIEAWLDWAKDVEVYLQGEKWRGITLEDGLLFNRVIQGGNPGE